MFKHVWDIWGAWIYYTYFMINFEKTKFKSSKSSENVALKFKLLKY